jgi:TonB-dependent receptor
MKHCTLRRSPLAQGVALALGVTTLSPAFAQAVREDVIEEVVVTGLRRSLQTAESIKRDASGVVDAITNEDIGKFPDTNLAEAIQRIPGVTIDRVNNEGSRVTVRGFGPEYNLVTLNGRSMPGGIGAGQSASRSFDFANLSADSISSITVFKTGRADIPSGGIGSTIDIRTARPFDFDSMRATFQAKAIDDTSSKVGSSITPEVSGLFSDTFLDGTLGVLVNGSYSKRNSRLEVATIGGWLVDQIPANDSRLTGSNQNPGRHNWEPQSEGWGFNDYKRTRTNGQAVLQFKPVESLVATADYTYALFKNNQQRHSMGAWFGAYAFSGDLISAKVNEHGTITDSVETGNDLSYFAGADEFRNKNGSAGLNVKWQALDSVELSLDAHHSTADSGGGPGGNNAFFIVGQNPAIANTKTFSIGNNQIPSTTWLFKPPYAQSTLDTSTISPLFAQDNTTTFRTVIDEIRLDLVWKNNSESALKNMKFGLNQKKMTTKSAAFNTFFPTGFYDPANNGLIPASAFTKVSSCSILKSFSGGGCGIAVPTLFTYSVADAVAATTQKFNYQFVLPATPNVDHHIKEDTPSAYMQFDFDTDFNGMRFRTLAGVRYEKTTVTANSLQKIPTAVSWDNPTEFHTLFASSQAYTDIGSSYGEFLPSLDMSLQLRRDTVLRASYSKTIARSDLTSMVGTQVVSSTPKPGARTVTAGNPALLPYESNNFDLSVEWYYTNDSYLAANWFSKQVTNFLTQTTTKGPVFGLTDPLNGALAQKALAELQAAGKPTAAADIFAQMLRDNPGQTSFTGQPGDPLVIWDITAPSNANRTQIHGFEFAAQHVFGESGFGVQANVSLPTGGAEFNNLAIGSQFALPGLSKSYNLVGFYEKYGFQARLAYTHRSSFLTALSQDQSSNEPQNFAAYGQVDASASYDINKNASVFVDAINLTSRSQRVYGRYTEQFLDAFEGKARYQLGFRVKL